MLGLTGISSSTCSTDTHERPCPSCPGCPPGERPEDRRREASVRGEEEAPDCDEAARAPRRDRPLRRANSRSSSTMRAVCCSTIRSSWTMRWRKSLSEIALSGGLFMGVAVSREICNTQPIPEDTDEPQNPRRYFFICSNYNCRGLNGYNNRITTPRRARIDGVDRSPPNY